MYALSTNVKFIAGSVCNFSHFRLFNNWIPTLHCFCSLLTKPWSQLGDVQYLIAYTSSTGKLVGGDWTLNKVGLNVSSEFGFGAIDAKALVTRAHHWITVPPQLIRQTVGEL